MGVFIPILALLIPVLAIGLNGLRRVQELRLEELRLRHGADDGTVEALRGEVDELRRELVEVHERLDFTERLLARNATADRLPGGDA